MIVGILNNSGVQTRPQRVDNVHGAVLSTVVEVKHLVIIGVERLRLQMPDCRFASAEQPESRNGDAQNCR